ncbi:MFS transporter [Erythrobacter sp.]|uniref:MFS transporter n=1 Tax=Erythrobacter sp. TaxID=1042 RepID=UPI001425D292|nr:MFS transporter [Erythrobacter sp.]QIQ86494.1 MAG: MFS transporter [Erythrobacter sp.]
MTTATHLLRTRRFFPMFATQFLNAFNDNLYKTTMLLFVVYAVYNDPATETLFSGIASAVFILPFVVISGISGQLADMRCKARIIRTVKLCEIGIMSLGALGLYMAWSGWDLALFVPLGVIDIDTRASIVILLFVLLLAGCQSTFLAPIKYAILPQHLKKEEVLAGTGLVEAGTYVAILLGTILAGPLAVEHTEWAAGGIVLTALVGYAVSRQVPDAPAQGRVEPIDWNLWRSSIDIIKGSMEDRPVWYAIIAISFFWTIGAVLFIQFPPLAKNTLAASPEVASLFLVMFSVGIALGSVSINALLKGAVSARFAPVSVVLMGGCVIAFYLLVKNWNGTTDAGLLGITAFLAQPLAVPLLIALLGIAVMGGMFVVPLYAFLTTRVAGDKAARVIAANNIVNSAAMVGGSLLSVVLTGLGVEAVEQVLLAAAMSVISAWLGRMLYRVEREEMAGAAGLAG